MIVKFEQVTPTLQSNHYLLPTLPTRKPLCYYFYFQPYMPIMYIFSMRTTEQNTMPNTALSFILVRATSAND